MELGPFRLLKRLGQGAQGDVWKAKRLDPRVEVVALKVLNPALSKNPSRLAQFRREAERGARLDGPSLLQVFEFGDIQGYLYMAMPFVEGTTLQQVIRGRRAFLNHEKAAPVHRLITMDDDDYLQSVTRLMAKASRALGRVHEARVVHRDIKPANILLDCHGGHGVYLCDLGLGRDLEVATPEQMRDGAGTPMYMAPERLLKAPADEILCDIYSLGVTLFESFTLDRPFLSPKDMPMALLSAHLAKAEPRRPREITPNLPPELELIILKAISRDPLARHNSARELAHELEQFLVRWCFRAKRLPVGREQIAHSAHISPFAANTAARTGTG
jgi:serine/threonine-protein kinase